MRCCEGGCLLLMDMCHIVTSVLFCAIIGLATTCCLMRSTAGAHYRVVDVYNGNTGAWSTAQLSVARSYFAAASVGNLALFAGGSDGSALLRQGCVWC